MNEDILYIDTDEYEEREVVFGDEDAGKRLDAVLAERFPDLSRSRIQGIIEKGGVRPENFGNSTKVKAGDIIRITVNERISLTAMPEDIEIDVVYEDEDVLVVDKARGMVVHPAKGNVTGTLVNALMGRYGLSGVNGGIRPGIVHRIDKNTSGLLVVAKNDETHMALAEQFAAHTIERRYKAIVLGGLREDEGLVDMAIGRDPKNRQRQAVLPGGKRAVTHWRVAERLTGRMGAHTLLELELETGRTHQIRVHMAAIGRPVLGDDLYGPARGFSAGEGQYLHAAVLGFAHPRTGEHMRFESTLPAYFTGMLDKLR
ncbi:MAG: RluA family pseudouridine synthase [Clostridiales bacterium]|nr:RluA family pseudouridine synthase [Clostridiales bacterium]